MSRRNPARPRQSLDREVAPVQAEKQATLLILTNGRETEPNYFNGFQATRNIPKNALKVVEVEFHEGNQLQTIEQAIRRKNSKLYGEIWSVLDVEDLDKEGNRFQEAIELADENNVRYVYSNRQIEVWFLFHFSNGRASGTLVGGDKILQKLTECVSQVSSNRDFTYGKACNIYGILQAHGDERAATDHAEAVLAQAKEQFPNEPWKYNPSTTVHELVEKLRMMVNEHNNN